MDNTLIAPTWMGKIELSPSITHTSDAVLKENDQLKEEIDILKQKQKRMKWLFAQLLSDLPNKRDWLDPDIEQEMKYYANEQ